MDDRQGEQRRGWWHRLRHHWAGRWFVDLCLVAAVLYGVTTVQSWHLIATGEPAPNFALSTLAGERIELEALRGKKVLLVFWAPWCGVCGAESDNISAIHSVYADDSDVEVLSVVLGHEGIDTVQAFVAEHDVTYPVLLGHRDVQKAYRIDRFPTAYVISESGQIEDTMVGYTTQLGMHLRLML
ncbi:MAG: redoxin domain-containing protein [Myxococcota bacterium]